MGLEINKLDVFIGKQIRLFRKKMENGGLKSLAGKLGISIQQLQKYETAKNKVSASLLFQISQTLQISMDHFFAGYEEDGVIKTFSSKNLINVLLIEDSLNEEMMIREVIHDFPETIELYTIHNGPDTLEFMREFQLSGGGDFYFKPDLILVELHMNKFNGLEILKIIKKDKNFSSIPVIIFTDSNDYNEMIQSYNLNASGFIVKSSAPDIFKNQIHDLLNYWTQVVRLPKTA